MSLVNEALKKAHAEASRRHVETAAIGPRPAPKLYSPELHKPKTGFVIALVATVFIVALSATVLRVTAESGTAPAVSKVRPTPVPEPAARVQPRVSLPAPPESSPVGVEAEVTKSPEPASSAPTDLGHVQHPSANYETATSSSTPSSSELVEGKVYIQSIDLPGVPKVQLNGVLWSDKPLAILNNITVAPGEELNDVTVVVIEPKRVKLRAQGKEFFIRLP